MTFEPSQGTPQSLSTQTVRIEGYGGDEIEAYLARPHRAGSRAGMVVVHGMFGYDSAAIESVVRLAWLGYDAVCPNLFWREAPSAPARDGSDIARLNGGVPDERVIDDIAGARTYLRSLTESNGRVGIIGFGAGAREAVLVACHVDFDAAVECYGEFIVGEPPDGMFPFQTTNIVRDLPMLRVPLLGLFGKEGQYPSPAQVAELEEILDEEGKPHEFHSYEHAGHGFMSPDHSTYRVSVANDAWERITAFLSRYLGA
jgi:carboxymethylenebutenolidase